MIEQNSNFFDQLDGGWGDLIADTYAEEAKKYSLLMELDNGKILTSKFDIELEQESTASPFLGNEIKI